MLFTALAERRCVTTLAGLEISTWENIRRKTWGRLALSGQEPEEMDIITLQAMYRKFVTECPSGVLFLHEFKRFFNIDPTGEASEYAENMFRAFDKNGVRDYNDIMQVKLIKLHTLTPEIHYIPIK